jgi:hypothetical protein
VLADIARGGGSPADRGAPRSAPGERPRRPGPAGGPGDRANAAKADEYRASKTGLLGFFVGEVNAPERRPSEPRANQQLAARVAGGELRAQATNGIGRRSAGESRPVQLTLSRTYSQRDKTFLRSASTSGIKKVLVVDIMQSPRLISQKKSVVPDTLSKDAYQIRMFPFESSWTLVTKSEE